MPFAHEPVNPARHARACAWLRAASRLLSQGCDRLFTADPFWSCRKGQERPFRPLLPKISQNVLACGFTSREFHLAGSKRSRVFSIATSAQSQRSANVLKALP